MILSGLLKRLLVGANGRRGILSPVSVGNMGLKNEDLLQYQVTCFMKEMLATGRYKGTFFHIPNESGKAANKLQAQKTQQKKKALGLVPGAHDNAFMWDGGNCFIELKHDKNKLTPNQEDFRDWSEWAGVPARVAYSVDEVEQILIELGALSPAIMVAAE